ncbi:MAG: hypothetical protein K8Q91_02435 [Candidatus Vogelbacteria bacterium]|nr:hypothetical protein [Candidatus Vogelbacteria bacterium]
MNFLKHLSLRHRWSLLGFVFLMVIIVSYLLIPSSNQIDFTDERVVYLRSIDRENLTYYAVVDEVSASLDESIDDQSGARDFSSIQRINLSTDAEVSLIDQPEVKSVSDLQSLLVDQPVYTGKVFTIKLVDGQITNLIEENLE